MQKIAVIFFLISSHLLFSQGNTYNINEYNTAEGLSQSVVHSVIQDSRGFIWAGTQDGLNRFDGENFITYKHIPFDSNSIANSYIWEIIEDADGNLWIGTYGGGLDYYNYNSDTFSHYKIKNNANSINGNDVRAIYEDNDGSIWVGTNNGLNKLDRESNTWQNLSNEENNIVPYKNIRNIYPHNDEVLWLAAYGTGLVYFNKNTKERFLYSSSNRLNSNLSSNDVWEIYRDNQGIYWVLTFGGGVNLFNSRDFTPGEPIEFNQLFHSKIGKDLTAIFEKSNGEILIGTDTDGLVIIDSTRNDYKKITVDSEEPGALTKNSVWDIIKDDKGDLWLGTYGGGLNYMKSANSKFGHFSTSSNSVQLNNSIVFVIRELNKNEFAIGTYGGGLNVINKGSKSEKYYTEDNSQIASNYITDIVIENDSSYWLGTDGKGLSHFNPIDNSFVNYNTDNLKKLPNDFVKCMLMDSYNNIWVGTLEGVCNIQQSGKVKDEFYSDKIFNYDTRSLLELKPGVILFGTHGNGLYKLNLRQDTFTKIQNDLLNDEQITQIHSDGDSLLWVGTKGRGLIRYNLVTAETKLYTEMDGLSNNTVLGIEEDKNNRLWITTNNGLSVFDKEKLKFVNYYSVDGLLSNEFVQGSVYKNDEGIIYAGNVKGVEIINPVKFSVSNYNPPVQITKISVLNRKLTFDEISGGELNLSYNENFIKINFAALDYTNPKKNQYRYRLLPGSEEWIDLGNENTVNFANLPPNNYLIELSGSNSDGIWSSDVERLSLIINPPFYNTYWFYALVIFTIGFVVYRFYYLRIQKKLEMDSLRLKIAKDLHDDVGSSLSQISLNADMMNYERDIDKIRRKGEIIRTKSSEMINIMNDVIWSIDSRKDKLESLVERIKSTATQFASTGDMAVQFDVSLSNPDKKLKVNFRQNAFLIVKEAINNAVKYSGGEKIDIQIHERREMLKIIVSDDGRGLHEKDINNGSGLKNMKLRANDLKGKIEFKNDNGLVIELIVTIN